MEQKTYKYVIEENELTIGNFIARYHFDPADEVFLLSVGRFLSELVTVEAEIMYYEDKVVCAATLGAGYDKLCDVAEEAGKLFLAYSLECFSMEFLSKAYEKMNETVYRETGKWMGAYRFLGDGELEELEDYTNRLSSVMLQWKNGMLRPLKSVIFTAAYKEDRKESGCDTCENCKNTSCSFRRVIHKNRAPKRVVPDEKVSAASYGISRIFGTPEIRKIDI